MNRSVLMIAYHFPPVAGSSGIQRTLGFARYLPAFGWRPIVLTVHPRAYERCDDDQLADIPEGVEVLRAPAWDTSRHFAIAGRYPAFLARPDRWVSWWWGAMPVGLRAIRRLRPDAIWSTFPIATAHSIGRSLAGQSRLPWMADFRDPMAQEGYPADPKKWQRFSNIERAAVEHASISTFTTPGAADLYRERYPARSGNMRVLENGFDEEIFANIDDPSAPLTEGAVTILHSGVVYPRERDPTQLFAALGRVKVQSPACYTRLRIRFRAPMHETLLRDLAREHAVEDVIEILPPLGYREALTEMMRADALLVLQAGNCNQQVPAKLYEYFRTRRPVLVLTDPEGDTAAVARSAGIDAVAALTEPSAIADLLERFTRDSTVGATVTEKAIASASRRGRAGELASLLDEMTA